MYENGQLGLNNPTTLLHNICFLNTIFLAWEEYRNITTWNGGT
jgi:hypothetical protein